MPIRQQGVCVCECVLSVSLISRNLFLELVHVIVKVQGSKAVQVQPAGQAD